MVMGGAWNISSSYKTNTSKVLTVPTCKFWGSCSILVAVDGRCFLVHLIGLLALLHFGTSRFQLAHRDRLVINTAVRGQQTPHLHRNLSGWGVWSGVDRRRRDGWQRVSEDGVFVGDVWCATVLVPHLSDKRRVSQVKVRLVYTGFRPVTRRVKDKTRTKSTQTDFTLRPLHTRSVVFVHV